MEITHPNAISPLFKVTWSWWLILIITSVAINFLLYSSVDGRTYLSYLFQIVFKGAAILS